MATESKYSKEEFDLIKKIPMLFVMGKERSGTTLLQTLLDSNPNIVAPPESEFIILLYPRFGKIKNWTEKDVLNFIEELFKDPFIANIWRLNRDQITSKLLSIKDYADYPSICKVIYYTMRGEKDNILWISDKNPMYVIFIDRLLLLFPEAKFIQIVREPRDNIYSHLQSFKATNPAFLAQKWVAYNNILRKNKLESPEKFHTILYEDLVQNPELTMKTISEFLKVLYTDKMVHNTFPERLKAFSDQQFVMDRAQMLHSNLLQPVNTTNIGKWKKGMRSADLRTVEKITGSFAAENYNYDITPNASKSSLFLNIKIFFIKILYSIWQAFTRMKYKSYWFNNLYTKANLMIGRETRVGHLNQAKPK